MMIRAPLMKVIVMTNRTKQYLSIIFMLGFIITGVTVEASAQRNKRRKPKIIRLEDIKVEGKIAGPEAVFIINMKDLQFEGLEPKKSFIPLIIKSVESEPF
jgi:hypothetical protein